MSSDSSTARSLQTPSQIMLIDDKNLCNNVDYLLRGLTRHLLHRTDRFFEIEFNTAVTMESDPKVFLQSPFTYLLGTEEFKSAACQFKTKENREEIYAYTENFLQSNPSITHHAHIRSIVAELFLNAVYNAKNEADRCSIHVKDPFACSTLSFGLTSDRLAIAVEDPFGSLRSHKLLQSIWKANQQSKRSVNMDHELGGAGLGSSIILDYSISLTTLVEPGVKTFVCVVVPLRTSQRQLSTFGRNFHILELTPRLHKKEL